MTVHDLFKHAKLGYSRVADDLVPEIGFGLLGRTNALAVVTHSQNRFPSEELRVFLDLLGISEDTPGWLASRLPHGEPDATSTPPLSAAAESLLTGFKMNDGAVHDPLRSPVLEKDLEVTDRVD